MRFALLEQNFTAEAASLWGDLLSLDRPATFQEAKTDFDKNGCEFSFDDYFDGDEYKGPCSLGISVENRNE